MADKALTLTEHLASQQAFLSRALAPNGAAIIGRVAAIISQELAHAAFHDRQGYLGGISA